MDIRRCYDILGVEPGTPMTDIREAYRDLVSVWHPDRFAANPRLRQKAEEKLKQINIAYDTLRSQIGTGGGTAGASAGPFDRQPRSGDFRSRNAGEPPNDASDDPVMDDLLLRLREYVSFYWINLIAIAAGAAMFFFLLLIECSFQRPAETVTPPPETRPAISRKPEPALSPVQSIPEPEGVSDEWIASLRERMERAREQQARWEKASEKSSPAVPWESPPESEAQTVSPDGEPSSGTGSSDAEEADSTPTRLQAMKSMRHDPPDRKLPPPESEQETQQETGRIRLYPLSGSAETDQPVPGERSGSARSQLSSLRNQLVTTGSPYRIRDDGTVLDRRTGLIWCLLNSYLESGEYLDYWQALRYVRELRTGGYTDWRLPRAEELAGLYMNPPFYPDMGTRWYWSGDMYSKGWHRIVRIIVPRQEASVQREYATVGEFGAVHAVRP